MIEIAVNLSIEFNPDLKIIKTELKNFLNLQHQVHIFFFKVHVTTTEGVAMGSPFSPVLANLFRQCELILYRPYLDDIIVNQMRTNFLNF